MLNSFASLTGRNRKQITDRWNNAVNPVLKKGPWTKQDTVTILTLKRDLEKSVNPTIAKTLNRSPEDVRNFLKHVIDPLKLQLSQDDDEFDAIVNIAWAAVQKANLRKHHVYRRPDPTSEPETRPVLSEIVQNAQLANKEKDERKRKLDELKTKREEEEAKIRSMIITTEDENDLADPNCKKEWVLKLRAVERKLLDRGIPKTLLDNLAAHYKSQLRSGDKLLDTRLSKKSREAATKDLPFE